MKTNQIVQIVVGGIALLLLAAVGISTLDNANSLAKLEETLNAANPGVVENGGQVGDQGQQGTTPGSSTSNDDSGSSNSTPGVGGDVSNPGVGSGDVNTFEVITPNENNTVVLSSLLPEIQIQLKNADPASVSKISARILILKRVLSATEIVTLSKGISSDEAKLESIKTATTNVTLFFRELPPTGTYKGWLIVTGEGVTPTSKELTFEITSFPAGEDSISSLENVSVLLPSNDLPLSQDRPQINFSLENLDIQKNVAINAQLLIVERVDENAKKIAISGYASESMAVELKPSEIENVTLKMGGRLPPAGKYSGWLVISGEKSQLITKQLTLIVAADPQINIQSRFTGRSDADKNITITGIRNWPLFFPGIDWNSYELKLWESNLKSVDCTVIASELADKMNGRTGSLTVEPISPCSNVVSYPVVTKLTPSGINYPGSYTGSLRIIAPADSAPTDVISVNVLVRDRLIWPALVIFFGVVISGIAIRFALGDGKKNAAYLEYLIEQGKNFADKENDPKKTNTLLLLDMAERNLEMNDLDSAFKKVKEAYITLGLPSPEAAKGGRRSSEKNKEIDKLKILARRVRRMSFISTEMWAAIATVAGLIYIGNLVPTFGSPMDYILALGWALGVSTVSKPAENIAASILKILTDQDKPEQKQEPKPPEPLPNKVKVPDVENKSKTEAEEELKKFELKPIFKSKNNAQIEDGWVVIEKTDPPADADVNKNSEVSCTLGPKPSDDKKEHKASGSQGNNNKTKKKEK